MKNKLKLLFFLSFCCTYFSSFAQSSASATFTASVTIVEPIEIKTTKNMNFASIHAGNGGLVILNPDDSRISMGDVSLANSTVATAAIFEVKGQNSFTYDIEIPKEQFVLSNGNDKIIIRDFKLQKDTKALSTTSQTIRLGASLEIHPNQKPGKYITSAPLRVTVSYN